MKNLIYGMLAMSVVTLTFACQKDNTSADNTADLINAIASSGDKQAVTVAQLPTEVREYVALSFTPLEIEAAWRVRGRGYEVELEDGQDFYFRENGRCIGTGRHGGIFRCMRGDTVDVSELPQAASDYVTANYPDATIEVVVYKAHGDRTGYAVELSDDSILLFNGTGEFVNICGQFDGGGHGGHGGHHGGGDGPDGPNGGCVAGDAVEVADLPAVAADYVTANYPGETITVVVVKPSGKFGVKLVSGTVLLFTAEGAYIKECDGQPTGGPGHHHCNEPITIADLPQAAQDYIAANYAGETVERGCVKNNGNYIVRLSNDVKILFDADGNVLFDSGN